MARSALSRVFFEEPHLIMAEACRRSLFKFVKEFWSVISDEKPIWNWHIPFLCNELEQLLWRVIARRPKEYDLLINIPPGSTKTTVCSIMFPAWAWVARPPKGFDSQCEREWLVRTPPGKDPRPKGHNLKFITGSYKDQIALDSSSKARDIIWSDQYRTYFPEIELRGDKSAQSLYTNTLKGERVSTSVGTNITGKHAHIIIIDDPMNPEQANSDAERLRANDWIDNLTTRKVDKEVTPTVLIMQRFHEDDSSGHFLKKNKRVKHIKLPCSTDWPISPPELGEKYTDGLLDPIRLPQNVLDDMKVLGSYGFAGQFGQDPRPREGGLFQKTWFEIVDSVPDGGIEVRGWDLAASKKKQGRAAQSTQAATSGVKLKIVNPRFRRGLLVGGQIYVLDDVNFFGLGDEVRRVMRATATQDGAECVQDIPQDPGQAGKDQVRDLVANLHGFPVKHSVESGDKVVRAEPFSSQCEAGNVKLLRGAWNEAWLDELAFFPNGRKDRVDATVRAYQRALKKAKQDAISETAPPISIASARTYDLSRVH